MTTMYRKDVTCRVCDLTSEQTVLGSTNAFGSSDLDLRPPEMQRSTMGTWLQLCPHCGFCGPDLATSDGDQTLINTPEYRGVLANQKIPELSRRFLVRAMLVKEADPAEAAHSQLCAAWACDDAELVESAIECRLGAAALTERLRPFEDTETGLTRGAVLVDVLRRAGRFDQSASECEALLANQNAAGLLKQVLEFQLRLISARDQGAHCVNEAMRDG